MFFEKYEYDTASYVDDNTPNTQRYIHLNCRDSLVTWFKENHKKPKGDKCHLLVTTEKSVSINNDRDNFKKQKGTKTTRYKV